MRLVTERFLSDWALRQSSISRLREFVEDVDWDEQLMPDDERAVLLHTEAYIAGIDEDLSAEEDLRSYLTQHVRLHVLDTDDLILVDAGTSNADQTPNAWVQMDLTPVPA